jgi:hypothetical protein
MEITIEQIRKIVDKHCTEIPYEGTEVNKDGIVNDVFNLVNRDKRRETENSGGSKPFIGKGGL